MLLACVFGFKLYRIGLFHAFVNEIAKELQFHAQFVFVDNIFQPAMTVMAGSNNRVRAGCPQLIGLDGIAFHTRIFERRPQRDRKSVV